ncbi:hypothetical protein PV04_03603 [Phialophora macrospora]|uniref:Uncharacterized protein n=1 Tax=Phialophora macrospora TaxID=1851006 RepID=A0A0D2GGP3_9EURO|nr:hypothetical protein PV04_03603 [Phialophora macrospora]
MPVFGSFPGPEASSDTSQEGVASETAVKARFASPPVPSAAAGVAAPSSTLSLPSETRFGSLLPEVQSVGTEAEHGPQSEPGASALALRYSHHNQSLHRTEDKLDYRSKKDSVLQDIAACLEQSAACSLFRSNTSDGRAPAKSFVPALSDGHQRFLGQEQSSTWLDHAIGSGTQQSLVDFPKKSTIFGSACPHSSALSVWEPPRSKPHFRAFPPGPQRQTRYTCQDKKSTMQSGFPIQLCGPPTPSPLSSTYSLKSTPGTTPASSTFSLKDLLSPTNTDLRDALEKYAAVKMCAPPQDYDDMYDHRFSPQYVDDRTLGASHHRHQQRMESLTPRDVQYQEIYSPRDEDLTVDPDTHVNPNENINVSLQASAEVNDLGTADEHDVDLDIDIEIAIADENTYDEVIAAMPASAEDTSLAEQDETPASVPASAFLASVFASIRVPTSNILTPTCTADSPCALYPHGLDVDCRFAPQSIELHNTALAALVQESDPLTWEEVREHERRRWAAIGEMVVPQPQAGRQAGIAV